MHACVDLIIEQSAWGCLFVCGGEGGVLTLLSQMKRDGVHKIQWRLPQPHKPLTRVIHPPTCRDEKRRNTHTPRPHVQPPPPLDLLFMCS